MIKKYVIAFTLIGLLSLSMAGCGDKQTQPDSDTKAKVEENQDKKEEEQAETVQSENDASSDAQESELTDEEIQNMMNPDNTLVLMNGAMYTGMTNEVKENNPDHTYKYVDRTEDGLTQIVNISVPNLPMTGDLYEYVKDNIKASGGENVADIVVEDRDPVGSYPAYSVQWTCTDNEVPCKAIGVVVTTDHYTYIYYFASPDEQFESMKDDFTDILGRVELREAY